MSPIAVCIPVRNEARTLTGVFDALSAQRDGAFVVAVAFDTCRDDSAAIAAAAARRTGIDLRTVTLPDQAAPDAGRARRAAIELARRIVGIDGYILTTDADTRPASDWVVCSRLALGTSDIVCGRIVRRRSGVDAWRDPIEAYLDRLHAVHRRIDPVARDACPSHWHEGGASIGMTARAWDRIAAIPMPASGEDREIVRAARLAGLSVRQDPAVRVVTSARLHGRARDGLSDALRTGQSDAAEGIEPQMEHPDDVVARFRRAAIARAAFPVVDADALARQLGIASVADAAAGADSADAFVTALPLERAPHRTLPLGMASRVLAGHERVLACVA